MFWNEKMETLSGQALEELQLKRLKETVARTQNIGFYNTLFKDAE